MPRFNFDQQGFITEKWLTEELTKCRFRKEYEYLVIEGKLLPNDEFILEEILNCAFENGYLFIERKLRNPETDYYEFVFRRK